MCDCNCSNQPELVEIDLVPLVGQGGGMTLAQYRERRSSKIEAPLDGPRLPPTISAHPEAGREALSLIRLADAALAEFEKNATIGLFKVTFADEERARDLASHAFQLATAAKETPNTQLWIRFGDDTFGRRTYEDLPEFFQQSGRSRRHYNGVLRKIKEELDIMREICVRELAEADANEARTLLRGIVSELRTND